MADAAEMGAAEAVDLLEQITGETYVLIGRLSGGESGAHEVTAISTGQRYVVKWEVAERSQILRSEAVVLSERLRTEAGWPVPRQRTVTGHGCLFVLQDLMPGTPIDVIGPRIVDHVLELHARRLGLARSDDPSHWPTALIDTLTVGGQGYCLHESLRSYNKRTARLVTSIEEFGGAVRPGDLAGNDIVHWDLHSGNLLGEGQTLSGVIDTDFAVVGDASFDLVTLALSSLTVRCDPGVRRRLFTAAFDGLDELRTRAYLGHLFIRFIDWPIRRRRIDEIGFWLGQADRMLHL